MTLSVQQKFEKAAAYIQGLPANGPYQPTEATKLQYYGYYKQATVGDVNIPRPGVFGFDFVAKAKWDAWNAVKGISKEDAQAKYVALLVQHLEATLPKSEELEKLLQELQE